jgi:hypothetical protein
MGAKGASGWGGGAVNHSIGLVWKEVCILAQRATTPSKGLKKLFCHIY